MLKKFLSRLSSLLNRHRILLFVCYILSLLSIVDIPFSPVYDFNLLLITVFLLNISMFKAVVLTLLLGWLYDRSRHLRSLAVAFVIIYGIICAVNAVSFAFYGFGISRKLIVVFSQTNMREISEFIPGLTDNIRNLLTSWRTYAVLAATALFGYFVIRARKRTYLITLASLASSGFIFLAIFCSLYSMGRTAPFMLTRIPRYVYGVYQSNREFQAMLDQRKDFPHPEHVSSSHLADNIVLVIGESAARNHHSLYGYPLPTNPNLELMRDSLIIFTNAIGSSVSTPGNIERILTFKEDDKTFNDWYKYPLIIDLFAHAGYKTYYISNQERTGLFSTSSGAIAESADVINYVGAENSEDALAFKYDENTINPFRDYFNADGPKFIIIHLLGSHVTYSNRYPEQFRHFSADDILRISGGKPWINAKNAQTIAEYNNSILYTDHVLNELLKEASESDRSTMFVYLSDHGENVYDDRDFIGREEKYVEIPFFIYLNPAYRSRNAELTERLRSAAGYPVSSANLIYPLMTLSGTQYPDRYNPQNDFMSPQFKQRPRLVDEQPWKYDLIKNEE